MALPKINKTKEILNKKFRIISKDFIVLKSSYEYWQTNKKQLIFRFKDASQTDIERYDKDTKQWVDDDTKNYWYKDANNKNTNYIDQYQSFTVEFEDTQTFQVWDKDKRAVVNDPHKKYFIELRGNESFGTAKKLFDAIENVKNMGSRMEDVWYKCEQDGIGYKFSVAGKVPDELRKEDESSNQEKQKVIDEAIRDLKKDSSLNRVDIMSALINTYGCTVNEAQDILNKEFSNL